MNTTLITLCGKIIEVSRESVYKIPQEKLLGDASRKTYFNSAKVTV